MTKNTVGWKFDNTYSKLPESLLTKLSPHPVKAPILKLFNQTLSEEIGLDFSEINENEIALIFSGNKLPNGSETIAQAYAGHQFGHFTLLGDGRALIIGEHLTKKKKDSIFNLKVLVERLTQEMVMEKLPIVQC